MEKNLLPKKEAQGGVLDAVIQNKMRLNGLRRVFLSGL